MSIASVLRIDLQELEALEEQIRRLIGPEQARLFHLIYSTLHMVCTVLAQKGASIRSLRRLMMPPRNERLSQLVPALVPQVNDRSGSPATSDDPPATDTSADATPKPDAERTTDQDSTDATGSSTPAEQAGDDGSTTTRKRGRGHGRKGVAKYPGARSVSHPHSTLHPGAPCPTCQHGTLYRDQPIVRVFIEGQAPISAERHEYDRLRCARCGATCTEAPAGQAPVTYQPSATATLINLHYGMGIPFDRLARMQDQAGVPLPASDQWMLVEQAHAICQPIFETFSHQAAQSDLLFCDDTKGTILDIVGARPSTATAPPTPPTHDPPPAASVRQDTITGDPDPPSERAVHTTCIIACRDDRTIALYRTGQRIAGENVDCLLAHRDPALPPPILMADALSHNNPKRAIVIRASCLIHGRRNFVNLITINEPEALHVIKAIAAIYRHEHDTKAAHLDPEARMRHHQIHSQPILDELRAWMAQEIDQKRIEPNSALGKACAYINRHWDHLTRFLTVPGAPLDNNICERGVKFNILLRKNSYFYKTRRSARIGDDFLGLLHTSALAGINAWHYLHALLTHPDHIRADPTAWLPWSYQSTLACLAQSAIPTNATDPLTTART